MKCSTKLEKNCSTVKEKECSTIKEDCQNETIGQWYLIVMFYKLNFMWILRFLFFDNHKRKIFAKRRRKNLVQLSWKRNVQHNIRESFKKVKSNQIKKSYSFISYFFQKNHQHIKFIRMSPYFESLLKEKCFTKREKVKLWIDKTIYL